MKRALLLLLMYPLLGFSHEPIFGLGPGTIFRGGVGVEAEYVKEGSLQAVATEVLYGLTEDVSLTLRALQGFERFRGGAFRVKVRVWKDYDRGKVDALSLIGGITTDAVSGTSYLLGGVAVGRESRRWYFFADMRTADRFYADTAVGIRPWLTEYLKPDLVLLSELNYEQKGNKRFLFVSPAFFFTYRNLAVKGGVQIPTSGGEKERYALSAEVHF